LVCGTAAFTCTNAGADTAAARAASAVTGAEDAAARAGSAVTGADTAGSALTGAEDAGSAVTALSRVWLLWAGVMLTVGVWSVSVCWFWRRAQASTAHSAGDWTGASGASEADGLRPTQASTRDATRDTTSDAATGSLDTTGTAGVSGAPGTAAEAPATDTTAACVAAAPTAVDGGFSDVERVDPDRVIGALRTKVGTVGDAPCGTSGAVAVATGAFGVPAFRAIRDGTAAAEGAGASDCSVGNTALGWGVGSAAAGDSAGVAVAVADTPVWVGSAPADALVSLLDGVEPVCAPPELCTTPVRGSAVDASPGDEVEPAWPSAELGPRPDVEPDDEPAVDGEEFAADAGPADDESDDDESDDDESDDELEELESVGAANATPGVVATAPPTPSATASAPTRPMYLAYAVITGWLDVTRRAARPG